MQAMYLVVAAVLGSQQPVVPEQAVEGTARAEAALARAQRALDAAAPALARLTATEPLRALEALPRLDQQLQTLMLFKPLRPQQDVALARAQRALDAAAPALARLAATEPLRALEPVPGLDQQLETLGLLDPRFPQQDQDPTDSLWRAARQALNKGDYTSAANLFGDLMRRYPKSPRAGDALYWAAFALTKNDDLDRARSLIVTEHRDYPRAATLRDADALLARIQAALAQRGDAEAAAWLNQHANEHAKATADTGASTHCVSAGDDDDVRIAALNGLLQMDAERALPILKRVLARRDRCSVELRRKAVFIVSQKRDSETENILLDVVQHDPDAGCREQAVFWLSQVPTERAVTMLDSILQTSHDDAVREKALFALSQQHSPRAAVILRGFAENAGAPPELRDKAIFWIGQQHSPENAAFLRALYAKLTDEDLKEKVIFSIAQMHGEESGRWLLDIAVNEREPIEMRKKALFWAGQQGADLGQLSGLYERIQNQEMKEQLIFVYSQRHEPAALDELFRIAKTERDKELRKKAIFWLGQSHDPRAAQVLMEIINQ
ncbi:MAG TPA: HEAT repeat domain-containing protein [Gemmatimonadales bacterium]|nr:HEAT repeat domain-containing protein [Gemmatimonadales bacterium]